MSRSTFSINILVMIVLTMAACGGAKPELITVEKTIIVTQEVIKEGHTVVEEVVVTATPEMKEASPRTLVICQGQEPSSLYYYRDFMLAKGHVLEAIYDGPIDTRYYDYQPVILKKLPSLTDGDATLLPVTVKPGDRIVGDDGEVHLLEPGVIYRPAGRNASDCALTYAGNSDVEMDQLSAIFMLLPGLKWSDGTPLTSSDSVYSFKLAADPDTPTSKYTIERTASYEAIDEFTVVWMGLPGYKDAVYFTNFWRPFPEHIWGQYNAAELQVVVDREELYVGWGPYIFDEWVKGDHVALSKNPSYFRADEGLPYFDRVVYRFVGGNSSASIAALLSGECDILDQSTQLDNQSDLLLKLEPAGQLHATFVRGTNFEHADFTIAPLEGAGFAGWDLDGDGLGPFGDVRLRQAIALCMDRQAVVDTVTFGQSVVLDSFVAPEHPLFNPDVKHWPFDVIAGSDLLEEIGWVDEDGVSSTPRIAQNVKGVPDGTHLEFSYATTDSTMRRQASQILADSMAQCGIKVNLEYYQAAEFFADGPEGDVVGRRTDIAEFAWLMGVEPSCEVFMSSMITGPEGEVNPVTGIIYKGWGGTNHMGYVNSQFDHACNAALQSLHGQPGYTENYLAAQIIIAEELPVIPLFLRLKLAATRSDMCNFIMDPTSYSEMWNIENFNYGEDCVK